MQTSPGGGFLLAATAFQFTSGRLLRLPGRNRNAGTAVRHQVIVAAGMACMGLNRLLQLGLSGIPCQTRQPGPTVRAAGLAAAGIEVSIHARFGEHPGQCQGCGVAGRAPQRCLDPDFPDNMLNASAVSA